MNFGASAERLVRGTLTYTPQFESTDYLGTRDAEAFSDQGACLHP
jgi:hypothetical protein